MDLFPAIAVERGYMDIIDRLRVEAAWWFVTSEGSVKVAIVLAIDREKEEIVFEQWKLVVSDDGKSISTRTQYLKHIILRFLRDQNLLLYIVEDLCPGNVIFLPILTDLANKLTRCIVYYKVGIAAGIAAGIVAGFAVDEVCYAGTVRGGGEFGGVGWKTGFPVLEFYFESVKGIEVVVLGWF